MSDVWYIARDNNQEEYLKVCDELFEKCSDLTGKPYWNNEQMKLAYKGSTLTASLLLPHIPPGTQWKLYHSKFWGPGVGALLNGAIPIEIGDERWLLEPVSRLDDKKTCKKCIHFPELDCAEKCENYKEGDDDE